MTGAAKSKRAKPESSATATSANASMALDAVRDLLDDNKRREAKAYVFGAETPSTPTALPALDRMNEKLARRLRSQFESLSRNKVKLSARPTTTTSYDQWQSEQPDYRCLSIFSFLSSMTLAMVSIDAPLIMRFVDARYGGSGATVREGAREFTSAEEHFATKMIEAVAVALNDNWNDVVPVNFQLKSRETNQAFVNIAHPHEQVAIVSFDVEFAGMASPPIQIIYPLASLRQVERELAISTREEAESTDFLWRSRLRQALGEVRTSARTVLARPEMRMAELMKLKAGDIIPVSIPAHVPLLIGNRQVALGVVGDHNGVAAIRIERITN